MRLSDRLASAREASTFTSAVVETEELEDVDGSGALGDAYASMKARASEALMGRIGARINDPSLTEDQLHAFVREELTSVIEGDQQLLLTSDERRRLVRDVEDDALGLGPLERMLEDDSISEIMVNRYDQVYVERRGRLTQVTARFASEDHLRRVIERIVSKVGRRIDESSPLVDARLADGSRVNAVIPPLAVDGSSLTIRKFSKDPFTVTDLIGFGSMTEQMAHLLQACVQAKLNILVSGGTGTGKTTLLNVLSRFIPAGERIVTIEDAVELNLQQPHVVRMEARPANIEGQGEVTIRDLVRNSLRMRPDRIVVGAEEASAEAVMREIIGRTPIQTALTEGRQDIQAQARSQLQELLDEYGAGVRVRDVQLLAVDPPGDVIDAFNEVQRARQDRDRLKNEAEAFRNDIVPRARGAAAKLIAEAEAYRSEVVNRAAGDASRFDQVYQAYTVNPDVTKERIYIETVEEIFANVEKIIIDEPAGGSGVVPYLPLRELNKKSGGN